MLKSELIERAARFRSAGDDPSRHLSDCPALVLNADYTPLSYYPLSLWPWQTAIKAVFLVATLLGVATLWMAVFADTGAALIVIANGMRLLAQRPRDLASARSAQGLGVGS